MKNTGRLTINDIIKAMDDLEKTASIKERPGCYDYFYWPNKGFYDREGRRYETILKEDKDAE